MCVISLQRYFRKKSIGKFETTTEKYGVLYCSSAFEFFMKRNHSQYSWDMVDSTSLKMLSDRNETFKSICRVNAKRAWWSIIEMIHRDFQSTPLREILQEYYIWTCSFHNLKQERKMFAFFYCVLILLRKFIFWITCVSIWKLNVSNRNATSSFRICACLRNISKFRAALRFLNNACQSLK